MTQHATATRRAERSRMTAPGRLRLFFHIGLSRVSLVNSLASMAYPYQPYPAGGPPYQPAPYGAYEQPYNPAPYAGGPGYGPPGGGYEEIRTIFVTGFPEDTAERELINMCRFLPDYEVRSVPPLLLDKWRHRLRVRCRFWAVHGFVCSTCMCKLMLQARDRVPSVVTPRLCSAESCAPGSARPGRERVFAVPCTQFRGDLSGHRASCVNLPAGVAGCLHENERHNRSGLHPVSQPRWCRACHGPVERRRVRFHILSSCLCNRILQNFSPTAQLSSTATGMSAIALSRAVPLEARQEKL